MYGKEFEKAKEALEGKRDDVYPCREDVPEKLWGKPIIGEVKKEYPPIKAPDDYIRTPVINPFGIGSPRHSVNYKFDEDIILEDIQDYIDSTYDGHYNRDKFQATEFILDGGHGAGFCIGNILKYAQRYGKKGTSEDARKDLLKVIHYAIIALYNHDEEINEKR